MAKAKKKEPEGITDLDGKIGTPAADGEPFDSGLPPMEPTPPEPKKAPEPKAKKTPEPATLPALQKPVIALRVFKAASGIRREHFAGFELYAKREKLGPATINEWRDRFAAFQGRPVKSLSKG